MSEVKLTTHSEILIMAIIDLFSKRQKKLRGEVPDIFTYDQIPQPLRVQILQIIQDALGADKYSNDTLVKDVYEYIHKTLCREYGLFKLCNGDGDYHQGQVLNFILQEEETEKIIDAIELSFKYIDQIIRIDYHYSENAQTKILPDEAIDELNERLKEHGIGYSFDGGEMIRIDSTFIHIEITKPTIALLWNPKFQGPNEEYLKAHEHYRNGRNKECLNECLKAFESTMKVICNEKVWAYSQTDTARKMIQICFQNGLVPTYTQN